MFVRGENGPPCARMLLAAIESCEHEWAGDRAYRDVLFKLDQVEQEIETLCASPGQLEARRAQGPNHAGQVPEERAESPSYVQ
jgi:hypothetical protein